MAKIDIISGFLGAGKTTLIQKLLKEALKGEKVVLIENEFGEIGIDGGFLKDAGIEVTEMNSGCICCSLVGDFGSALKEVVTQYDPDRIIIEPSGVGKLSDVIKAVQGVAEDVDLDLNSFVTVADAKKCKMYIKNFGEFYNNQVEYAGSIILSRTGDVAEDKLNESVALLREHNEKAAIITTPWDELSGEQILKVMEDGNDMAKELLEEEEICPVCGGHHDHEHEHEHDCDCGCENDGILTLTDEDGNTTDFVVIDGVESEGTLYLALVEKDQMDNEESEYIVLKVVNEGEDEEALVTVDDEDEFNTVIKLFEAKADNAGLFDFDIPSED